MAVLGGSSSPKLIIILLTLYLTHQDGSAVKHLAVEINEGPMEANRIAEKYGLTNLGQVGELDGFYHFVAPPELKRSITRKIRDLKEDPHVQMVELQKRKRQQKKAYYRPSDPLWSHQWQLLNRNTTERLDLNVERVWMQGITGSGVTVAIVDDGIEYEHPDLSHNYDPHSSYDFVGGDADPSPYRLLHYSAKHGTNCAGVVGMGRDNEICGVGIAYNAGIAGIRLLSHYGATDIQEAIALTYRNNQIDIYSNSWGPHDLGYGVGGPEQLTHRAFETGVKKGRNGRGSIYVWAAGNGGMDGDSCVTDGYVSSIYTIAVGSADVNGAPAYYDERCSSKLVVVYIHGNSNDSQTITTSSNGRCSDSFTGTSAAAPMVAGTLALALQANPTLTWRDVQYLLVHTSDSSKLSHTLDWRQNGAGLWFSHQHGFGAVNAESLVTRARYWTPVPAQIKHEITVSTNSNAVEQQPLTLNFTFPDLSNLTLLEHVVVVATISIEHQDRNYSASDLSSVMSNDSDSVFFHRHARRGDIEITLTSPQQTTSTILPFRPKDFINTVGFDRWPFMSVHFWGENPAGEWSLSIAYRSRSGNVQLTNSKVIYYGTHTAPKSVHDSQTCSKQCAQGSGCAVSSSSRHCDACSTYRNPVSLACLPMCPNNTIIMNGYCINQQSSFEFSYSHPKDISPTTTTVTTSSTLITAVTAASPSSVVPTSTNGVQKPTAGPTGSETVSGGYKPSHTLYVLFIGIILTVLVFL